jgi:hypothetical protein
MALDLTNGKFIFEDMTGRITEDIVPTILAKVEKLEVEAARLVVLARACGEDGLDRSASVVYETVIALGGDLKRLQDDLNGRPTRR